MFAIASFSSIAFGQTETNLPKNSINFTKFMERVGKYNLEYNAELLNLDIALAEEESAKVFEDPNLTFGAIDNGQRRKKMGYELESAIEWRLELGGKRKARMNIANSQVDLTRVLLIDYFNNLRVEATIKFLEVIKEKNLLDVKTNSYVSMKELAHSDSIRFELGDILEVDARQSKIETTLLFNELIQQKADWENSIFEVNRLIGYYDTDYVFIPDGKGYPIVRDYQLNELLVLAQENRSDLKAALENKHISESLIKLVKAERNLDLDLSLGIGHNTIVSNIDAFAPALTSITAGIAIPLKFSNRNKGKLKAAQFALSQSEILYQDAKMSVRSEVHQAFTHYQASKKQFQQFDSDLLSNAKQIMDAKIYSYQRGETSFLEVLNAQSTFNEIQERYYESLFVHNSSLIMLQQVAGIWDIGIL